MTDLSIQDGIVNFSNRTVVVASDIHLGSKKSQVNYFYRKLENIKSLYGDNLHLILLGDIFDFWRCDEENLLTLVKSFFENVNERGIGKSNISYGIGNHDYQIRQLKNSDKTTEIFRLICDNCGHIFHPAIAFTLNQSEKINLCTHGDLFDFVYLGDSIPRISAPDVYQVYDKIYRRRDRINQHWYYRMLVWIFIKDAMQKKEREIDPHGWRLVRSYLEIIKLIVKMKHYFSPKRAYNILTNPEIKEEFWSDFRDYGFYASFNDDALKGDELMQYIENIAGNLSTLVVGHRHSIQKEQIVDGEKTIDFFDDGCWIKSEKDMGCVVIEQDGDASIFQ